MTPIKDEDDIELTNKKKKLDKKLSKSDLEANLLSKKDSGKPKKGSAKKNRFGKKLTISDDSSDEA